MPQLARLSYKPTRDAIQFIAFYGAMIEKPDDVSAQSAATFVAD